MLVVKGQECKNKNIALSKEWLETNKIGGYSYSTILNINNSPHHSILTIMLPNSESVKLVPNLIEKFNIGKNEYITNSPDSGSFLEKFYIDTHPHFIYNFNGIKVLKSIIMPQYKNLVVLKYETENIVENIKIELVPIITGSKIKGQIIKEKEYIKYSREDIPAIYFYFKGANFIEEKSIDTVGHKIGKFAGEVSKEQKLFLIITTERISNCNCEIIYNEEIENRVKLTQSCGVRNELYKNILFSLNSYVIKKDDYEIIVDGYPSLKENPSVVLQSMAGILYPLKKFNTAKKLFKYYLKNEIIFQDYMNNSPLWFIYSIYQFIQHTGDWKFVKDELWHQIKLILNNYFISGFKNIRMDTAGFLQIEEKSDKFLQAGKPIDLNVLWYNVLRIVETLSAKFTDIDYHIKTQEISFVFKLKFFKKFWNKEYGYLNNCVDIPPDNNIDSSLKPNQLLCLSLPFNDLLNHKTQLHILDVIRERLLADEGVRTLSPNSSKYKSSDIKNGALVCYYWGQYLSAVLNVNSFSKLAINYVRTLITKFEKNFKKRIIGYLPFGFSDDMDLQPLDEPASALAISEYVRIIHEEFGKFSKSA